MVSFAPTRILIVRCLDRDPILDPTTDMKIWLGCEMNSYQSTDSAWFVGWDEGLRALAGKGLDTAVEWFKLNRSGDGAFAFPKSWCEALSGPGA